MSAVLWFRRDLRLFDHPALAAAVAAGSVAPLFVLEPALLSGRWSSPNRNAFLLRTLRSLDDDLRARGTRLHVRAGDPRTVVPRFAAEAGALDVFVSRDYSPYARARDRAVGHALESAGVRFHARPGTLAVEPEDVLRAGGSPLRSYSQFKKRWDSVALREPIPAPSSIPALPGRKPGEIPTAPAAPLALVAGGESAARARLDRFLAAALSAYASARDFPGLDGATSRISQDLRFGLLSPVEVIHRACAHGPAADKFVAEVVWREYFTHILWSHPQVLSGPLDRRFERFPWRTDPAALDSWQMGQTGYPLVDAAMHELVATGYIHNRARMVAASFLVKHLLIDWREGERFFMQHLVDGDPANNNGGWQWVAGCGTDAQPFFRIFNPVLQGQRFDPAGDYVRRWLPALRDVPGAFVHAPWQMPVAVQHAAHCVVGRDYPAPMVDHGAARQRALDAFAVLRAASA